ncbi:hypothetical protein [Oceanobacillus chungangensis]|uniref:Uncharacterized protein n=1 Tax=Oceanobacillus chungangensis TaxID=1229152 RepID=A0A3D8PTA3_9BACI|nr:hypothetical protein [Oceanobacillus chungangensis]RDW19346.1 hypothetical protein CWR45_07880 [Oceanobacillus chungangensis]
MSMPTIPNITPKISLTRCETIDLLLSSIALEEIGLSHIINAEAEKIQFFLKTRPDCLNDYLKINESVNKTLRTVVKSQMLLQFKLEDVAMLDQDAHCKDFKHRDHHRCEECECDECECDECNHKMNEFGFD